MFRVSRHSGDSNFCWVRSIENKKNPTMGTVYAMIHLSRYNQLVDIHPEYIPLKTEKSIRVWTHWLCSRYLANIKIVSKSGSTATQRSRSHTRPGPRQPPWPRSSSAAEVANPRSRKSH